VWTLLVQQMVWGEEHLSEDVKQSESLEH
jgi:hypothetical protein